MITIGDLRAREVLPSWQEAVAIVQELIDVTGAAATTAAAIPDVQHVGLGLDGSIVVLPGQSASVSSNDVQRLAVMLDLLLEGVPVPDQLRALVSRNATDRAEFQKVGDFSQALSFFARPGRRSEIQALAERANAASERTRADEELRRLQAKALEAERSAAPEQKKDQPQRRIPPLVVVAALTAGVLLISAGGVLYFRAKTQRADQSDTHPADSREKPTDSSARTASPGAGVAAEKAPAQPVSLLSRLSSAVRTAASAFGRSAPSEVVPPPPPAPAKMNAARRRSRKPAATAAGSGDGAASLTKDEPVVIITELGGYALEPTAPDLLVDNTVGIYSRTDAEVKAPVMVRPVLPTAPPTDVPADQLGTLELLVDERGNVEHVRLVSPFNRHQERMIVANAKAWKFRPATRGGRPVKYQSRIRLTI
jgi:hypothetical protein